MTYSKFTCGYGGKYISGKQYARWMPQKMVASAKVYSHLSTNEIEKNKDIKKGHRNRCPFVIKKK